MRPERYDENVSKAAVELARWNVDAEDVAALVEAIRAEHDRAVEQISE